MADRDFAHLQATARPARPPVAGMSGLRVASLVLGIVAVVIAGIVGGYELGRRQGHETAESEAKAQLVAQIREQKQELAALRSQQAEDKARAKADAGLPDSVAGDLTFYTDLPKQSVKPQPLAQPVAKPAMTPQGAAAVAADDAQAAQPAPVAKPAAAASQVQAQAAGPAPVPAKPASPVPAAGGPRTVGSVIRHEAGDSAAAVPEGYYVQVASFRDTQAAAKVQARLAAIGLDSGLRRADVAGRGTWYRLQVGPYGSAHDANAVRVDIEQKMHIKGIVVHEGG